MLTLKIWKSDQEKQIISRVPAKATFPAFRGNTYA